MDEILSYRQYVRPFYVMAKPAGARCNLRCTYCYYLEKSSLYPAAPAQTMSDELLERFIRDYIAAQAGDAVSFAWHGGETLLRSRDFYRRVVELQRRYADGRQIDNSIQTNGTLLDDAWCEFFRENGWLVGISLDGPPEAHDLYRRDRQGGPTFEAVMRGVALLQKHGVEWNALAVVNRRNADDPAGFYRFFRSIGCRFLQFTPVVERILPHDDGRQLASAADAGAPLADFRSRPNSGDASPARCSTSGSSATWGVSSCSCSTPRWPTGWAKRRASARSRRTAVMRGRWSSTAISTPATTSSSPNTSWETSSKHRSRS